MRESYVSKVAELRNKKNLTQRELANLIDVDSSTIRNWERDRDGMKTFVRIAKLCQVLECDINDLFETVESDRDES